MTTTTTKNEASGNDWRGPVLTKAGFPWMGSVFFFGTIVLVGLIFYAAASGTIRFAKSEPSSHTEELVKAVEKLAENWDSSEKYRLNLKDVAQAVSKEILELRKENETLKKKLAKFDNVQKAWDDLKRE